MQDGSGRFVGQDPDSFIMWKISSWEVKVLTLAMEMSHGLQHRLATRYEHLATSLSSPHPTKPVIDLFV
jgi:hypothetical protein